MFVITNSSQLHSKPCSRPVDEKWTALTHTHTHVYFTPRRCPKCFTKPHIHILSHTHTVCTHAPVRSCCHAVSLGSSVLPNDTWTRVRPKSTGNARVAGGAAPPAGLQRWCLNMTERRCLYFTAGLLVGQKSVPFTFDFLFCLFFFNYFIYLHFTSSCEFVCCTTLGRKSTFSFHPCLSGYRNQVKVKMMQSCRLCNGHKWKVLGVRGKKKQNSSGDGVAV